MAKTFKEMLDLRNELLHSEAVYQHVINHLEEFIAVEGGEPDEQIETEEAGPVPQEMVQHFINKLREDGLDLVKRQLANLEQTTFQAESPEPKTKTKKRAKDGEGEEAASGGEEEGGDPEAGEGGPGDRKQGASRRRARARRGKAPGIQLRS